MKVLVGAACIAVLTFVGYFFWGEWQRAEVVRIAERERDLAFRTIAEEAGVTDGNRLKVRLFCDGVRDLLQTEAARHASVRELDIPRKCEAAGL